MSFTCLRLRHRTARWWTHAHATARTSTSRNHSPQNEADARAIFEAARIQVCPGHNRLFDPPFLEMRRRVEAGEIGRVLSVGAEQGFGYESVARAANIPWTYRYDWGIYENFIPHALYLVTHFLAAPGAPLVAAFDVGTVREAAVEVPGIVQRLTAGFHATRQQAAGSMGLILGVLTGRILTLR